MDTFAILILLTLLCALLYVGWQHNLRSRLAAHVHASCGTADKHTLAALSNLGRMSGKSSQEKFQEARLLDLNVHEGKPITDKKMLAKVTDGYLARAKESDINWFEVDQIEQFYERNKVLLPPESVEDLAPKAPERIRLALDDAKEDKERAYGEFVKKMTANTPDPQNVHDSGVNAQLRGTVKRLRETTFPVQADIYVKKGLNDLIDKHLTTDGARARAKNSLDTIYTRGSFDSTISANEKEILALVFARASMPQNRENAKNIQIAILDSLVDMTVGESIVCDHGRAARLLESLVLLDSDQILSCGAVTLEQIRNDAFAQSAEILQKCIAEAIANEMSPEMTALGKCYKGDTTVTIDPATENIFKDDVKQKIRAYVDKNYKDKLTKRDHRALVDHCTIAVETL